MAGGQTVACVMLFETEVRDQVHRFLGGDVPHSGRDAARLTDSEKLTRRLHAIDIMAMERRDIAVEFWQEEETLMHTAIKVSHGSTAVYVAPGMSSTDARAITGEFLQVYGGDPLVLEAVIAATVAQPAAPPPGRYSHQQFAETQSGKTITVEVGWDDMVLEIAKAIQVKEHIPFDKQRLVFGGKQQCIHKTLAEYRIMGQSPTHLFLRLRGC